MKTLYYYEGHHSDDIDRVECYIAVNCQYVGEDGLMRLCENEIGVVDDLNDLRQYCIEYGHDYEELRKEYE